MTQGSHYIVGTPLKGLLEAVEQDRRSCVAKAVAPIELPAEVQLHATLLSGSLRSAPGAGELMVSAAHACGVTVGLRMAKAINDEQCSYLQARFEHEALVRLSELS